MKYLFLLLLSLNLLASGDRGNGADASVCRDSNNKILKATLFDFDEGLQRKSLNSLIPENLSLENVENYLNNFFKSYEKFDLEAKGKLHKEGMGLFKAIKNHLETNSEWVGNDYRFTSQRINNLKDSFHDEELYNCPLEQFVIRKEREFEEEAIYKINSQILRFIPNSHLLGLVIHEVFYHYFKSIKKINETGDRIKDSRKIRYLVQHISHFGITNYSKENIGKLSVKQFLLLVSKVDILNKSQFSMELTTSDNKSIVASKYPLRELEDEKYFTLTAKHHLVVVNRYGELLEKETLLNGGVFISFNERKLSSHKFESLSMKKLKKQTLTDEELSEVKNDYYQNYLLYSLGSLQFNLIPFGESVIVLNSQSAILKKLLVYIGNIPLKLNSLKTNQKQNKFVIKAELNKEIILKSLTN